MAKRKNPATEHIAATPDAAGQVVVNPSKFDVTAPYAPDAYAAGDLIEIGVVPVGCVLVRHLSAISIDAIAVTAGALEIGTEADPDALAAAGAATAARVLTGEELMTSTGVIGSRTQPTPIYARVSTAFTDVAASGLIRADLAVRAFEAEIDG